MAPWDSRMRWQPGGNYKPLRLICELNWKECPFAMAKYFWSEMFTDVVDFFSNEHEGMTFKILLALFIFSFLYTTIRWIIQRHFDKKTTENFMNNVEFRIQNIEYQLDTLDNLVQFVGLQMLTIFRELKENNNINQAVISEDFRVAVSNTVFAIENYQKNLINYNKINTNNDNNENEKNLRVIRNFMNFFDKNLSQFFRSTDDENSRKSIENVSNLFSNFYLDVLEGENIDEDEICEDIQFTTINYFNSSTPIDCINSETDAINSSSDFAHEKNSSQVTTEILELNSNDFNELSSINETFKISSPDKTNKNKFFTNINGELKEHKAGSVLILNGDKSIKLDEKNIDKVEENSLDDKLMQKNINFKVESENNEKISDNKKNTNNDTNKILFEEKLNFKQQFDKKLQEENFSDKKKHNKNVEIDSPDEKKNARNNLNPSEEIDEILEILESISRPFSASTNSSYQIEEEEEQNSEINFSSNSRSLKTPETSEVSSEVISDETNKTNRTNKMKILKKSPNTQKLIEKNCLAAINERNKFETAIEKLEKQRRKIKRKKKERKHEKECRRMKKKKTSLEDVKKQLEHLNYTLKALKSQQQLNKVDQLDEFNNLKKFHEEEKKLETIVRDLTNFSTTNQIESPQGFPVFNKFYSTNEPIYSVYNLQTCPKWQRDHESNDCIVTTDLEKAENENEIEEIKNCEKIDDELNNLINYKKLSKECYQLDFQGLSTSQDMNPEKTESENSMKVKKSQALTRIQDKLGETTEFNEFNESENFYNKSKDFYQSNLSDILSESDNIEESDSISNKNNFLFINPQFNQKNAKIDGFFEDSISFHEEIIDSKDFECLNDCQGTSEGPKDIENPISCAFDAKKNFFQSKKEMKLIDICNLNSNSNSPFSQDEKKSSDFFPNCFDKQDIKKIGFEEFKISWDSNFGCNKNFNDSINNLINLDDDNFDLLKNQNKIRKVEENSTYFSASTDQNDTCHDHKFIGSSWNKPNEHKNTENNHFNLKEKFCSMNKFNVNVSSEFSNATKSPKKCLEASSTPSNDKKNDKTGDEKTEDDHLKKNYSLINEKTFIKDNEVKREEIITESEGKIKITGKNTNINNNNDKKIVRADNNTENNNNNNNNDNSNYNKHGNFNKINSANKSLNSSSLQTNNQINPSSTKETDETLQNNTENAHENENFLNNSENFSQTGSLLPINTDSINNPSFLTSNSTLINGKTFIKDEKTNKGELKERKNDSTEYFDKKKLIIGENLNGESVKEDNKVNESSKNEVKNQETEKEETEKSNELTQLLIASPTGKDEKKNYRDDLEDEEVNKKDEEEEEEEEEQIEETINDESLYYDTNFLEKSCNAEINLNGDFQQSINVSNQVELIEDGKLNCISKTREFDENCHDYLKNPEVLEIKKNSDVKTLECILLENNCESLSKIEFENEFFELAGNSSHDYDTNCSINVSTDNSSVYLTVDESLSDVSFNNSSNLNEKKHSKNNLNCSATIGKEETFEKIEIEEETFEKNETKESKNFKQIKSKEYEESDTKFNETERKDNKKKYDEENENEKFKFLKENVNISKEDINHEQDDHFLTINTNENDDINEEVEKITVVSKDSAFYESFNQDSIVTLNDNNNNDYDDNNKNDNNCGDNINNKIDKSNINLSTSTGKLKKETYGKKKIYKTEEKKCKQQINKQKLYETATVSKEPLETTLTKKKCEKLKNNFEKTSQYKDEKNNKQIINSINEKKELKLPEASKDSDLVESLMSLNVKKSPALSEKSTSNLNLVKNSHESPGDEALNINGLKQRSKSYVTPRNVKKLNSRCSLSSRESKKSRIACNKITENIKENRKSNGIIEDYKVNKLIDIKNSKNKTDENLKNKNNKLDSDTKSQLSRETTATSRAWKSNIPISVLRKPQSDSINDRNSPKCHSQDAEHQKLKKKSENLKSTEEKMKVKKNLDEFHFPDCPQHFKIIYINIGTNQERDFVNRENTFDTDKLLEYMRKDEDENDIGVSVFEDNRVVFRQQKEIQVLQVYSGVDTSTSISDLNGFYEEKLIHEVNNDCKEIDESKLNKTS